MLLIVLWIISICINGGLDNGLVKVLPILTPDNTPEVLTTLGIHTEEQLKEQKLIFKTLLNTVKDGLYTWKFYSIH